jgi:hypothetical protein
MLDTGTPWGLLLNGARVPLPDATFVPNAKAGSGQAFDVVRATGMPPLVLHHQTWPQVHSVHACDLSFLEQGTGIGPFLGFIGANFFADTALTLDQARRHHPPGESGHRGAAGRIAARVVGRLGTGLGALPR